MGNMKCKICLSENMYYQGFKFCCRDCGGNFTFEELLKSEAEGGNNTTLNATKKNIDNDISVARQENVEIMSDVDVDLNEEVFKNDGFEDMSEDNNSDYDLFSSNTFDGDYDLFNSKDNEDEELEMQGYNMSETQDNSQQNISYTDEEFDELYAKLSKQIEDENFDEDDCISFENDYETAQPARQSFINLGRANKVPLYEDIEPFIQDDEEIRKYESEYYNSNDNLDDVIANEIDFDDNIFDNEDEEITFNSPASQMVKVPEQNIDYENEALEYMEVLAADRANTNPNSGSISNEQKPSPIVVFDIAKTTEIKETCDKCGVNIKPYEIYCFNCGARTGNNIKDICLHCGKAVKENAEFCTKCGNKILKIPEFIECRGCKSIIRCNAVLCVNCGKKNESRILYPFETKDFMKY